MIRPLQRLPLALRASLLVLALLGVLVRPTYSTWCETHQLGHELAALSHVKFRADSSIERQLDADHARGAHGLLHSDDGGVYAGTVTAMTAPVVQIDSVLNPVAVVLPIPVHRLARPFRPPIA